jgi:hypothetical protein
MRPRNPSTPQPREAVEKADVPAVDNQPAECLRRGSALASDLCNVDHMPEASPLLHLLATPELADLGPGPRRGVQPESELNAMMDKLIQKTGRSTDEAQLIRALILLWHDHLDSAHKIAQSIENADGAFVHGIMHRREPDHGNAAYWFRRVGKHVAFPELASRVKALLGPGAAGLPGPTLLRNGEWDPFACIDACEQSAHGGNQEKHLLQEIQRIETEVLLEFLCGRAAPR